MCSATLESLHTVTRVLWNSHSQHDRASIAEDNSQSWYGISFVRLFVFPSLQCSSVCKPFARIPGQ